MRRIRLLFSLALILIGFGLVATGRQHLSQGYGFAINLAPGWECTEIQSWGMACAHKSALAEDHITGYPAVIVYADPWDLAPLSEPTTPANRLRSHLEDRYGTHPDAFEIGEIQSTQVNGEEAAYADVLRKATDQQIEAVSIFRFVAFSFNDREFLVEAISWTDQWESFASTFETMLDSMASLPPPTPFAVTVTPQQETINAVSSILKSLPPTPNHLLQEDAIKEGEEFDVNALFSVLTHLSVQPGYVLDWVYYYDDMGAEPVIYARPMDQPPHPTYSDYKNSLGLPSYVYLQDVQQRYLDFVQTDGTEEGFLEFVVLRTMATQFYLYWHALYNDSTIICDRTALEALLSELEGMYRPPFDVRQKARTFSLAPVVDFSGDDTVQVRIVIFSKWGGFMEETYTIRRSFPHEILDIQQRILAPFDCRITF